MADLNKQCVCLKVCLKMGENVTEICEVLKVALGEQTVGRTQVFAWFSKLLKTSVEDTEHPGHLLMSKTDEDVDQVKESDFRKQRNHYLRSC